MSSQDIQTTPQQEDRRMDSGVILTLLADESQRPWAVAELVREMGEPEVKTIDSISRLRRAGLIHSIGEFVFPTRPATAFYRLEM